MKGLMRSLIISSTCILIVGGCATPQSVRTLSTEQIKVQEGYLESQRKYFLLIEKFVATQIKTTESLIQNTTDKINEKYKQKALRGIDPNDLEKTKNALDKLTDNVLKEQKSDQESLARINNYYNDLKKQHRKMILALETVLIAQKKLNDYIQLEKADEVAVNQLLATIGLEKNKVEEAANTASTIYSYIETYIEKGVDK